MYVEGSLRKYFVKKTLSPNFNSNFKNRLKSLENLLLECISNYWKKKTLLHMVNSIEEKNLTHIIESLPDLRYYLAKDLANSTKVPLKGSFFVGFSDLPILHV